MVRACVNINIKLALATKSKYKLPPGGNYNGVPAVHLYDGRRPASLHDPDMKIQKPGPVAAS